MMQCCQTAPTPPRLQNTAFFALFPIGIRREMHSTIDQDKLQHDPHSAQVRRVSFGQLGGVEHDFAQGKDEPHIVFERGEIGGRERGVRVFYRRCLLLALARSLRQSLTSPSARARRRQLTWKSSGRLPCMAYVVVWM
eukprot:1028881-Rhodomonas_salina.3